MSQGSDVPDVDDVARRRHALITSVREEAAHAVRVVARLRELTYRAMQASDGADLDYLIAGYAFAEGVVRDVDTLRVLLRADRDS